MNVAVRSREAPFDITTIQKFVIRRVFLFLSIVMDVSWLSQQLPAHETSESQQILPLIAPVTFTARFRARRGSIRENQGQLISSKSVNSNRSSLFGTAFGVKRLSAALGDATIQRNNQLFSLLTKPGQTARYYRLGKQNYRFRVGFESSRKESAACGPRCFSRDCQQSHSFPSRID